jgi:hypothetical protein
MIDTDKYEGHLMDKAVEDNSQVWCWSKWLLKNAENIEQMNATAELLKDAPKLLAEVKRLSKITEYVKWTIDYHYHCIDNMTGGFIDWMVFATELHDMFYGDEEE